MQGKSGPDYLDSIQPPWNDGRKEIIELHDEYMIEVFGQRIAVIKASSAGKRALDDAGKAEKAKGGPGGQVRQ
jgi:hypothetical protein